MMGERGVVVRRGAPGVRVECEDCDYFEDELGTSKADSARQRAKAHAHRTGHTVYVERSIGTYFNPKR